MAQALLQGLQILMLANSDEDPLDVIKDKREGRQAFKQKDDSIVSTITDKGDTKS